jgi:spermidine synthase
MTARSPFTPLLLLLFVASGCAALIYEIVWFQLLQLVIGSSAVSLGVLLATFMGGMCVGSLWSPRLISPRRHPLRVYALLEIGIGILGIAVLLGMPYVTAAYIANAAGGTTGIFVRGIVCAVCLAPPTLLMGATLPAVSRWVETSPRGVGLLGLFYGGNTVGAVAGCMLAGFYLLRVHDMAVATYVAAAINGAAAIIALIASALIPYQQTEPSSAAAHKELGAPAVYFVIAISGMSALGAEVVWTRLLSLLLGPTVYTFSVILGVFLIGLAIGSGLGAMLGRLSSAPRTLLGICQLMLAAAIAWAAYAISQSLPYWPVDPSLTARPIIMFQIDFARCLWAIGPATLLWGASFPLALAAAAPGRSDPGRLVAGIYAANTAGAILGALIFSMVLIPWIGTQQAQRVMVGLVGAAAVILLVRKSAAGTAASAFACAAAVLLAWSVHGVPWGLVAYGRYLATTPLDAQCLYVGEGMNSSVAVTETSDGVRNFHVAGKIEASTEPQDMRLQRMLGHLPALLHGNAKSILVVGCGAGVTAGSFVEHPEVEKIVICEIEPLVPRKIADFFSAENYDVVHDQRVRIVYDDARHFVLTTPEKFDIITSDPIHPWVKGAATLYTREYFQVCKDHLNPGGIVTQWVPLYQSTEETVQSELATFFDVFPGGMVWSNDMNSSGYDVVLLGRADNSATIDIDQMQERLDRPDQQRVAASLAEVGFNSAFDLLGTFAGRAADLHAWLKDATINRDRNLRLQYMAGWGMDSKDSDKTFKDMLANFQYPDALFTGSSQSKLQLDVAMLKTRARH